MERRPRFYRRRNLLVSAASAMSGLATFACLPGEFENIQKTWKIDTDLGTAIVNFPNGENLQDSGSLVFKFDINKFPIPGNRIQKGALMPVPFSVTLDRVRTGQEVPIGDFYDVRFGIRLNTDQYVDIGRMFLGRGTPEGFNSFLVTWRSNLIVRWGPALSAAATDLQAPASRK